VTCGAGVLDAVIAHARQEKPAECCGILLGDSQTIVRAVPVRNVAASPTRYALDPAEHIAVRREARALGLEVIGFYHSHPATAAEPSPTDVAEATYVDHLFLIVSLSGEPPDVRLFRWNGAAFQQISLHE
jgi:proteasome lid subunit RPN8/RPN11